MRRAQNYLVNEGAKVTVLVVWLGVNACLFYFTFAYYYYGPQFYYLHEMLGYGLCISRATAACINLNACLVLLPMCKGVLRILRAFPKINRQCRRLMDKSKSFHIACGYMLCLMSAIHCGAHAFNAFNFCEHFNPRYLGVNVAAFAHQNPLILVLKSIPGITGMLMVASLTTIAVTASSPLRGASYRRFWKLHHLFIAFYILLLLHASSGILKYQSNTDVHIPGCFIKTNKRGTNMTVVMPEPEAEPHEKKMMVFTEPEPVMPEVVPIPEGEYHHPMPEAEPGPSMQPCQQPEPSFKSCPTEAWMWMSIPLFFYIVERITRYVGSSSSPLEITNIVEHPNEVIEVQFYQKGFKAYPGQSIWLRCPQISFVEAHPFTLSSVPTKSSPGFSIHMQVLGEWTKKAKELLQASSNNEKEIEAEKSNPVTSRTEKLCAIKMPPGEATLCEDASLDYVSSSERIKSTFQISESDDHKDSTKPQFYAHGPYGSAMQDVFRYETSLCIAGGIGITPFAAVLNMILKDPTIVDKSKLRRIYLIWSCKTIKSFEWFVKLINTVQVNLWNANKPDYLNVYLHVTAQGDDEKFEFCHEMTNVDRCRFERGRPDLRSKFKELSNRHHNTSIGVFCCGPPSLNNSVRKNCFEAKSNNKVKFIFNKESF